MRMPDPRPTNGAARRRVVRRVAVAAVAPLALSTLAACGGNNSASTATDPQATTSSAGSPTTTPTSAPSSSGPSAGRTVDPATFLARAKAAARSITTARFVMAIDYSGQPVRATGAMDMTAGRPAMQMSMDLSGMGAPSDLRLVDGAMYIQMGTGGKYAKVDLTDPHSPLGGMGSLLDKFDPQSMIDKMPASAFRKVVYVGDGTIHGQHAQHYHVVAQTAAAMRLVQGAAGQAAPGMPRTLAYDLWLDGRGRTVKMAMTVRKLMRMTMTFYGYGSPVHVSAPPASQVQAMPSGSTS